LVSPYYYGTGLTHKGVGIKLGYMHFEFFKVKKKNYNVILSFKAIKGFHPIKHATLALFSDI
jgi:hypothetical protein